MPSILNLNIEELEEVLASNELPEGVTLEGIEQRPDFARLFKHRGTPKFIAQALLKERIKDRVLAEPAEIKNERLEVKRLELELKRKRLESVSQQQAATNQKLQDIATGQQLMMKAIAETLQLIRELASR